MKHCITNHIESVLVLHFRALKYWDLTSVDFLEEMKYGLTE